MTVQDRWCKDTVMQQSLVVQGASFRRPDLEAHNSPEEERKDSQTCRRNRQDADAIKDPGRFNKDHRSVALKYLRQRVKRKKVRPAR